MFNPAVEDDDSEEEEDEDDDDDDDTDTSDNARVDDFWLDVVDVKTPVVDVAVDVDTGEWTDAVFREEEEGADSLCDDDERGSHAEEVPVLKAV